MSGIDIRVIANVKRKLKVEWIHLKAFLLKSSHLKEEQMTPAVNPIKMVR